ncbi:MAG: hypothetical protein WKF72_01990 [Nocardioidaceae bacterium]
MLSGDVHATMVNDVTLEHDPASAVQKDATYVVEDKTSRAERV